MLRECAMRVPPVAGCWSGERREEGDGDESRPPIVDIYFDRMWWVSAVLRWIGACTPPGALRALHQNVAWEVRTVPSSWG